MESDGNIGMRAIMIQSVRMPSMIPYTRTEQENEREDALNDITTIYQSLFPELCTQIGILRLHVVEFLHERHLLCLLRRAHRLNLLPRPVQG